MTVGSRLPKNPAMRRDPDRIVETPSEWLLAVVASVGIVAGGAE